MNGSPSNTFNPSRGLCQGDPLSPFLYTILVEELGCNLSQAKRRGDIKIITLHPEEEALSHLQFVDDTFLMGLATVKEAQEFKKTLDLFNLALGTIINREKSQVLFFNTPEAIQWPVTTLLGFQPSSLPSKYLGSPLLLKALHNPSWEEIATKVEAKISSWNHHFLSFPGCVLLINFVLLTLPMYLFLILDAHMKFLKKIECFNASFCGGEE
jgi:mannosylglycoprotein endo-beta-mannosidase